MPKPIILFSLKFNPKASKNCFIALAASAGLAVNINKSSFPRASAIFFATLNNGPFLPSITLLNSEKSNLAPCNSSSSLCLANSVALSLPLIPFGSVYKT